RPVGFPGCGLDGRSIVVLSDARLVSRARLPRFSPHRSAGERGWGERTGRPARPGTARQSVKGVTMKRIAVMVCAVLGLVLSTGSCEASWAHLGYSGYQPWWNIFAKRYKCLTPEEERLQKFWHDYYDSLKNFYKALDAIDWVAYYKNHGYQI